MSSIVLLIIFTILLLPGFAGIFLPLPGLLYMFIIALIYGFVDNFEHLGAWELGILGALMVIGFLIDFFSGLVGAKYGGAAQKSMLFGIIGMLIGLILFPPFGGLVGVFLGILLAEILNHGNQERALRAATGGLAGSLVGMITSLILSIIFLFLFIIFGLT